MKTGPPSVALGAVPPRGTRAPPAGGPIGAKAPRRGATALAFATGALATLGSRTAVAEVASAPPPAAPVVVAHPVASPRPDALPPPRAAAGGGCASQGAGGCAYPRLSVAIDGGISHFSEGGPHAVESGLGRFTETGWAWGARIGAEASQWLAFDVHYIGFYNTSHPTLSAAGTVGILTSGLSLEARLTLPLAAPWVQPYVVAGLGVYDTSISGSSRARAGTGLRGSTHPGVPLGIGLLVPLGASFGIGAEAVYHRFVKESFSRDPLVAGGDPVNVAMVVRGHL